MLLGPAQFDLWGIFCDIIQVTSFIRNNLASSSRSHGDEAEIDNIFTVVQSVTISRRGCHSHSSLEILIVQAHNVQQWRKSMSKSGEF